MKIDNKLTRELSEIKFRQYTLNAASRLVNEGKTDVALRVFNSLLGMSGIAPIGEKDKKK